MIEDIIKLRSRYGAVNYLKKMPKPDGSESKKKLMYSKLIYLH